MAYDKRTLVDGETVIDKELLDHIQDGIVSNESAISNIMSSIGIDRLSGNDIVLRYLNRSPAQDFFIRCPDYDNENDFVWWISYDGRKHNIQHHYTLPKTENNGAMTVGNAKLVMWKSATDDTAPLNFNGTYIAANHGATVVEAVAVTSHDKTAADIGSIWTSGGHTYMLVKINSSTSLWFIQTDAEKITTATTLTCADKPTGTLVHSSGATNSSDITINSVVSNTQLLPAVNNAKSTVYVDGEEISAYGTYTGKKVTLVNEYSVIYVPAILEYLGANVGNNTNASYYNDAITESFCTLKLIQEIHSNGSMNVYQTVQFTKTVALSTNFIAQFAPFGLENEKTFMYVPDTTSLKTITEHTGGAAAVVTKSVWENQEKVPYRFYSFANAECDKGYVIIYDRSWGWGKNDKRLAHNTGGAGQFASTKKLYPCFVSGFTANAGTYYDGCAVRIPIKKYHEDLTSVVWYWRGEDIILCIDSHKQVNVDLTLPAYMANKKIEILDQTESVISEPAYIFNDRKLKYATNSEYGYIILKLYD